MPAVDYNLAIRELQSNGWVPRVKPPKLADTDLPRIGHRIGVGEDPIHAVLDVEAPRGGYDSRGRLLPLYEPHVAFRAAPSEVIRAKLVAAGLAYRSWGEQPYPKGGSYDRFERAYAIHPETAIKACSWGRGQLLGENFSLCGYDSPVEMYVRMSNGGEVEHLEAMVSFIKAAKLDDELRALNWTGFARGYNGPQYAKNSYHTKLAARYAWWSKIPDTPWSPPVAGTPDIPAPIPGAVENLPPSSGPVWVPSADFYAVSASGFERAILTVSMPPLPVLPAYTQYEVGLTRIDKTGEPELVVSVAPGEQVLSHTVADLPSRWSARYRASSPDLGPSAWSDPALVEVIAHAVSVPPPAEAPAPSPSSGSSSGAITNPSPTTPAAPRQKTWLEWFGGIIDSIFFVDPTRR